MADRQILIRPFPAAAHRQACSTRCADFALSRAVRFAPSRWLLGTPRRVDGRDGAMRDPNPDAAEVRVHRLLNLILETAVDALAFDAATISARHADGVSTVG